MSVKTKNGNRAELLLHQSAKAIQKFGQVRQHVPIGLDEKTRQESVDHLNQVLVDTMTLRDLYKKHHWQVSGPTFYQLHLLFDKHFEEQSELVDTIAERIQSLGGVTYAMAADVAGEHQNPAPSERSRRSSGADFAPARSDEIILDESRKYAKQASEAGDEGSNDLLISDVVRTNELQAWFISEHVVDLPLVKAD